MGGPVIRLFSRDRLRESASIQLSRGAVLLAGFTCFAVFGSDGEAFATDLTRKPPPTPSESTICEADLPRTGYLPPPVDLSHIRAPRVAGCLAGPIRFDWREAGKVTAVRNQGLCGCCYAFAGIANIESRILVEGGNLFDFSENNVKECEWSDPSCDGGNDWMVANHLTTAGTVLEICDPYIPDDVECDASCGHQKSLQEWCVISGGVPASVEVLKSYLTSYGPIYTTLYAGSGDHWRSEFSAYDGSYTLSHEDYQTPNHAVLLVGWDDTLSHEGGQGAWIAKNSWGSSWGGTCGYGSEGGYFTIAYGSAAIGANSSFAERLEDYRYSDTLLFYDEAGFGGSVGITNSRTIWGLCRFEASGDIEVRQVELWTVDATPDIDIYIYDDFEGSRPADLLTSRLDNAFDLAGYHSIPLEYPLPVGAGEDIYVVARITNAISKFPLVFDGNGPRSPGSCYMSADGVYFSEFVYGDLGIRLRAGIGLACSPTAEAPALIEVSDVPADRGGFVTIRWIRSSHDDNESGIVKRYRVWRKHRLDLAALLTAGVSDGHEVGGPYQYGVEGPAWEMVGMVEANGACFYELAAPTNCDCTPGDTCWTYFCVTAHTGTPGEHFDSSPKRGYSTDDQGMLVGPEEADPGEPQPALPAQDGIVLRPPRPNPGSDGITITFVLPRAQRVDVSVYDVLGREMARLLEGTGTAGSHTVVWEPGPSVPPGTYFIRLNAPPETRTTTLTLIP